jgi:type VI secretion system protein ImpC
MADEKEPQSGAEAPATEEAAAGAATAVAAPAAAGANADTALHQLVVKPSYDAQQQKWAREALDAVLKVAKENKSPDRTPVTVIEERINKIDALLSERLDQILHNEQFQKLEASWRGLHMLVMNTETSERLKLRVMNISKDDLRKDLEKAVDFDQSALFKKVYEEEYGTFGGHPFSVLVGDYFFDRSKNDIALLTKLSNVAAAAHAPLIAAANSRMFDLDSFLELANPRDLSKTFDGTDAIKWRKFRDSDDARYVSLVLPRFLLRAPYGAESDPVEGLAYEENVYAELPGHVVRRIDAETTVPTAQLCGQADHNRYLWGNAAYALARRITDAFAKYGWCAAIRGVNSGGAVGNLPVFNFPTEVTGRMKTFQCPSELTITDRREKELSDLGFIALCHKKNEDVAVFFGSQTAAKPQKYNKDAANANARISAMLPYVLAASRFAHYVKVIMRDRIGSFMTRENVQRELNNWIADYVLINDNAPQEIKAQYPLREARVDVVAVAGKPGVYSAVIFLKPHFQLEELTASIRLVAELPPPATPG